MRYICEILEDVRTAHQTQNYSYLLGLIEEIQCSANRMENALLEQKDIQQIQQKRCALKDALVQEVLKYKELCDKNGTEPDEQLLKVGRYDF